MNRTEKIGQVRARLRGGGHSIGSWMQLADSSVAEIMGQAGYDWVAVDLEHGSISVDRVPDTPTDYARPSEPPGSHPTRSAT